MGETDIRQRLTRIMTRAVGDINKRVMSPRPTGWRSIWKGGVRRGIPEERYTCRDLKGRKGRSAGPVDKGWLGALHMPGALLQMGIQKWPGQSPGP